MHKTSNKTWNNVYNVHNKTTPLTCMYGKGLKVTNNENYQTWQITIMIMINSKFLNSLVFGVVIWCPLRCSRKIIGITI